MDIENLIEQYRQAADKWEKRHPVTDTFDLRVQDVLRDAATALSTLQAENKKLRVEAEGMRSNWYKSVGKNKQLQAELEQAKAEVTRLKHYEDKCHDCPIVCAKTEIIKAYEELEIVQAELEQVKAERDAAIDADKAILWLKDYVFEDSRKIYTNGARIIPYFRVLQALRDKAYNGLKEGT